MIHSRDEIIWESLPHLLLQFGLIVHHITKARVTPDL
jgi:hypothetical protein